MTLTEIVSALRSLHEVDLYREVVLCNRSLHENETLVIIIVCMQPGNQPVFARLIW